MYGCVNPSLPKILDAHKSEGLCQTVGGERGRGEGKERKTCRGVKYIYIYNMTMFTAYLQFYEKISTRLYAYIYA